MILNYAYSKMPMQVVCVINLNESAPMGSKKAKNQDSENSKQLFNPENIAARKAAYGQVQKACER